MEMNLRFPNPARSSADAIFGMEQAHRLTEDVEAQRQAMIDYLDGLNYMNGNSFDDPLLTRHAIAYMACAMPSLACIDPHKTREMVYNLSITIDNIKSKHLVSRVAPYNSDNVHLVQTAFASALFRLVSGSSAHDEGFHAAADELLGLIQKNSVQQHVSGVDTTRGRFEVAPNAMALLVLEIHDLIFGSRYGTVKNKVLSFINEKLRDPETGLFYESFQTGSIGYASESLNPSAAWRTDLLLPNVNGLALGFVNYFDPDGCRQAWESYKALFLPMLLTLSAEEVESGVGASFNTQLGRGSEDILAAMFAAKEMGDAQAFDALQDHLFEIGKPHLWEGHLFFTEFGELEHMIGHFALLARTHVGWGKILSHPWEKFYEYDYREVR